MTRCHRIIAAALCAFALAAAHAQPIAQGGAADDTLYRDLGGNAGLVALMDDFMPRLLADARMHPFFKEVDQADLKAKLVTQFCQVSGGPCVLKETDMRKKHDGFDINRGDFNRLVEVLQQSMDARGIPFGTQNRLLAKLAPMHREIVNVP